MRRNQIGDTIVEVMAAITIIGLALATAYALSNRSYRTGVSTVERTQALALAQGQVEFLKNLGLNGEINNLLTTSNFGTGGKFCFRSDNGQAVDANATDTYCKPYAGGLYDVSITYSGSAGSPPGVFTVNTSWDALGGSRNKLEVYYKATN
jgi:type II secretory pathway pseudopilin PulG